MIIKQNQIQAINYPSKSPHSMEPVGICVHNTANDASALNESNYVVKNSASGQTSYHFAVDDIEAYQILPTDRAGWHAGDGVNGVGNRKHIGIEICYSKTGGEKFAKAEQNAAQLIADLLKEKNWGIERVKKHQDFSGKYCPHRTLDLGWDRFINMIKSKLGENMSNMYGTPNKYDLSNVDSMKVAVDHLNDIQTGKYIKTTEAEIAINDAVNNTKLQYESQLKNANERANKLIDNHKALAIILGLGEHATHDHILGAVKTLIDESNNSNPPIGTTPVGVPETYNLNGRSWGLNGLTIDSDGKVAGNYKRND